MLRFDIKKMVPRFILADRNGFALAQAIEAGIQAMNDIILRSLKLIDDIDSMPEWRLDELAWEMNCLYDLGAGIEQKRVWIRNAMEDMQTYGTAYAIRRFLEPYFDDVTIVQIEDAVGMQPLHFRVYVAGENLTQSKLNWAQKAVNTAKNVRSICDGINYSGSDNESAIAYYGYGEEVGGLLGNFILGQDVLG